jgi:hypothetical protein
MHMETYDHDIKQPNGNSFGFYSSLATVILTVITFTIAVLTPPLSGPFCIGDCVEYPYTNISSRFPRDYYWMYPAMLLNIAFVMFMAGIHQYAAREKKIYSLVALLFGLVSSIILLVDYFVQVSVVQPSLLKGETEGIALISQYNPHGIFIALEELGYTLMIVALFCTVPVFSKRSRLEKAIRTTFYISFILTLLSFVMISVMYGIMREYRFEVVVITINCLTLIISGILLSKLFRHRNSTMNKDASK